MQTNTGTMKWVALTLFAGIMLATIFAPKLINGAEHTSTKYEQVTTGGDFTPPSAWTPGSLTK